MHCEKQMGATGKQMALYAFGSLPNKPVEFGATALALRGVRPGSVVAL